jgi:hypothetical protein
MPRVALHHSIGGGDEVEAFEHLVGPAPCLGPPGAAELADVRGSLAGQLLVQGGVLTGDPDARGLSPVRVDVEAGDDGPPASGRVRVSIRRWWSCRR